MIRKLNNKGMTAIEVLVTFVIVVVIVVSMYDGIMDLKNRETIASYKLSLVTYKNLLTKDIQDDLAKIGLATVRTESLTGGTGYRVIMVLRDGSQRYLEVTQIFGCAALDDLEAMDLCDDYGIPRDRSDEFSISYGPPDDLVEYPLPDLGHEVIPGLGNGGADHTVYSLKINEVNISSKDRVFSLHITLSHPDLGSDYSINIVTPLNYP